MTITSHENAAAINFPLPLILQYMGGQRWRLASPFMYVGEGIRLEIPEKFETDFNSIPRGLWNLLPPTCFGEAGVVHDWLYAHPGGRSRSQCDDIHGDVLKLLGAPAWKRRMFREGLRLGGWVPWRKHRRHDAD